MKLRIYPLCGHTDYSNVCFADEWESPTESRRKYIFFVSLHPEADDNYEFIYGWHPEKEIVRVEQLTPAKSKIDKALAHQLKYILGDKFIEYNPKQNRHHDYNNRRTKSHEQERSIH